MTPVPSVGRMVHYVSYGTPGGEFGQACRAAIVAGVRPLTSDGGHTLDLAVLNPTGIYFNRGCPFDDQGTHPGGSWHWPERTED